MRNISSFRLVVLFAASMLAACSTAPESRNMRLDAPSEMPVAATHLQGALQVQPFQARGLLGERRLVYFDAQAPNERKQSASFLWEETPPQAASIVVTQVLRAAKIADAVFAPDLPGIADYMLSARLDRFELSADGTAIVDLEVTILKGPQRQAFLMGSYCAQQPRAGDGAAGIEAAFDEAFRQVLVHLTQDMAASAVNAPQSARC
ncbi:MAG TPA: ABC-type transport auxiliary lipoprotein family protein [Rhizomicrobium sp.]|nr:ABC-type transport auxiliary lipoprotein family protein [Rhizomicrobium sp.]